MHSPAPAPELSSVTVLVFGGGDAPTAADAARLPAAQTVIAADRGADHALGCNRRVDLLVGDLDSVSSAALTAVAERGGVVERHEQEKDESDLELALLRAVESRPSRIVVTAMSGGRTDHFLANLLLVTRPELDGIDIDIVSGSDQMYVVRDQRSFDVDPGGMVTLLAMHGSAHGVTTAGLQYPLQSEVLAAGSPRGISNVAVAPTVSVSVQSGVVLAIVPGGAS